MIISCVIEFSFLCHVAAHQLFLLFLFDYNRIELKEIYMIYVIKLNLERASGCTYFFLFLVFIFLQLLFVRVHLVFCKYQKVVANKIMCCFSSKMSSTEQFGSES